MIEAMDCRKKILPPCPPVPFGGPASGLWPLGGAVGSQFPPACTLANLFSECFKGCVSPGNCGWTTVVGDVSFTGQNVVMDPDSGAAVIFKTLTGVPASGFTIQVRFSEVPGPVIPLATMAYSFGPLDALGNGMGAFQLRGDGTVLVQTSPAVFYNGLWTPKGNSAFHKVTLSIGLDGVPSLNIDQVLIPLALGGSPSPAPFGSAFAIAILNFGGPPQGPAVIYSAFVSKGNYTPDTIFCCPGGQAP
jgi:hypothetical protein